MPPKDIYTVSRLAFEARGAIEKQFPLIWIEGEISGLSRPASGHVYFVLKDKQAQVRCALFKNRRRQLGTEPENGKQVLIRARVTLYEGRSEFQILVEGIEPVGEGLLLQRFEALRKKLQAEGLFSDTHKQPLPQHPRSIALITSPTGAAIRDLLITLRRRYPLAKLRLFPSEVQGPGAAEKLCQRIIQAGETEGVDIILLARGGGSIEDLQAFNDEQLVRTIFASPLPIIAGIGHESDWTLADMVADLRAATPTAAAELATPDQAQLINQVTSVHARLVATMERRVSDRSQQLDGWQRRLVHPGEKLRQLQDRLSHNWQLIRQLQSSFSARLEAQLRYETTRLSHHSPLRSIEQKSSGVTQRRSEIEQNIRAKLSTAAQRAESATTALSVLNPLATLARGYAVLRDPASDRIITQGSQVTIDSEVQVQLQDAALDCTVNKILPLENP